MLDKRGILSMNGANPGLREGFCYYCNLWSLFLKYFFLRVSVSPCEKTLWCGDMGNDVGLGPRLRGEFESIIDPEQRAGRRTGPGREAWRLAANIW